MAVLISSQYQIGLVAGAGARFATPPAPTPAITTDDLYIPNEPTQAVTNYLSDVSMVSMVGSGVIDGTITGEYPLYMVPAGQTLICTGLIFALVDIEGSGDSPQVSVAFRLTVQQTFQHIISSGRLPTLFDDINQAGMIVSVNDFTTTAGHSGADFKYVSGGLSLMALVDVAGTYTTYRLECFVFGFLAGNLAQTTPPASLFGRGQYGQDFYGRF